MSEPYQLHRALQHHSELLLEIEQGFKEASDVAVNADLKHKAAAARALLEIKTNKVFAGYTVDEKRALVVIQCEGEMIDAALAKSNVDVLKKRGDLIEASLSAVQSEVKLILADARLDGIRT